MDADATVADVPTAASLRDGGAEAFAAFVDRWYGSTVRLVRVLTRDDDLARHAARDAWLGTINQLSELSAHAPVHVSVLHRAISGAADRVARGEPESALDAASFEPEASRWHGWWLDDAIPRTWTKPPSGSAIERALERLQPTAAAVVLLRDVEGISVGGVEAVTGLGQEAQHRLLHEGRTAVWRALAADPATA